MHRAVALALALAVTAACKKPPRAPPPPRTQRSDGGLPSAAARPPFPGSTLSTNAPRECFPPGFVTTRVRLRGTLFELCGLAGSAPRCYEIDPIANRVESRTVADAPTAPESFPRLEGPLERTELASRGWRVSTRGGALSVTGPAGNHRNVTTQQFGFHSYENTVLVPWTDGYYAVMLGVRGDDVGASAIINPYTLAMVSHSALLPCGRDA